MDFLGPTVRRNPQLVKMAIELHQSGAIPPNTHVMDYDTIFENSRVIASKGKQLGIIAYVMTKQYGRNPLIAWGSLKAGMEKSVAIEIEEARSLHRNGLPVGHLGHLVQTPKRDLEWAVSELRPDSITVFSVEKALQISEAASNKGVKQNINVRVVGPKDFFYPLQEGGFPEADLLEAVRKISKFPNVKVTGVTTFPSVRLDILEKKEVPLPNIETVTRSVENLRKNGFDITVVNMPGDSNTETLDIVHEYGGNQVEPGHGAMGTSPVNYFKDLPEKPALTYVSEITHMDQNRAFILGGGQTHIDVALAIYDPLYHDRFFRGLASSDPDKIFDKENEYLVEPIKPGANDYYYVMRRAQTDKVKVGDSVILGFRAQVFTTRAKTAVVKGLSKGRGELIGIFDPDGNLVGKDDRRMPPENVKQIYSSL